MAATRRYDEDLRTIGQALEARDISVFELKRLSDNYIVQGIPDQTGLLPSKVRHWLRRLGSGSSTESLALGLPDIERLSQAGQAKRSDASRLSNFQSASSILRTIGAYLDASEFELLELQKRRISITLLYRDKAGQQREEDRSISSFYRLFLELCGKRGQTQKHRSNQEVKFSRG
jgi:hypothetical protein